MIRLTLLSLWFLTCSGLAGCVTTEEVRPARADSDTARPSERAARQSSGSHTAVGERGTVPYDTFTLPLVAPSGTHLVTRVGEPPAWDAVLAEGPVERLRGARIEIYRLPQGEGTPVMISVVEEASLLSRSYDDDRFLIESPRANGARWIGSVPWTGGTVTWITNDDRVNAFPALGPNGRLAFTRRDVEASQSDLVVREASGEEWTLPAAGGDWLFPTWAGDGADGLFILSLREGFLDLIFGVATDQHTFEATKQRLSLAVRATRETAFQVVSGQAAPAFGAGAPLLGFFHPARQQAALWQPTAPVEESLTLLGPGSLSTLPVGPEAALVTLAHDLEWHGLSTPPSRVFILRGLHLTRPMQSPGFPIMLLEPLDSQSPYNLVPDQIRLRALAILDIDSEREAPRLP